MGPPPPSFAGGWSDPPPLSFLSIHGCPPPFGRGPARRRPNPIDSALHLDLKPILPFRRGRRRGSPWLHRGALFWGILGGPSIRALNFCMPWHDDSLVCDFFIGPSSRFLGVCFYLKTVLPRAFVKPGCGGQAGGGGYTAESYGVQTLPFTPPPRGVKNGPDRAHDQRRPGSTHTQASPSSGLHHDTGRSNDRFPEPLKSMSVFSCK